MRRPPEERASEPVNNRKLEKNVVPVALNTAKKNLEPESDELAYERNMKVLLHELKSDKSNEEHIQKLFKITHALRREKIQSSQSSITNLQNDYPFFEKGKWVRVTSI